MADTMTNEQILSEFENLFGTEEKPDEEETPTEETVDSSDDDKPEETAEEQGDESEETPDESDSEDKSEEPVHKDTKQSKQNYAFAEQRLQIKKNEQFVRNLGKLIGFDDKASVEEIQNKIKDVLIEKTAKENNISVDLAKRLDLAEEALQENHRIKLEKKVQEDFSELIDKHNLDEAAVNEFTAYLIENGKNPMLDQSVDLEAEYLKLHFNDMIQAAVSEALSKEAERKKKVEEKSPSGVSKSPTDKGEQKISSVKELDDLFANMDL